MRDKKNIDRLFREKFKDFEATPSNSVWENISSELHNKINTKKGIPIWWKVAGIAAALLLLITFNQLLSNNNDSPSSETIVDINSKKDSLNNDSQNGINNVLNPVTENKTENLTSKPSHLPSNNSVTNTKQTKEYNSILKESETKNVTENTKSKNDDGNISAINSKKSITASGQIKNAVTAHITTNLPVENSNSTKTQTNEFLQNINDSKAKPNVVGISLTSYDIYQDFINSLETNVVIKEQKLSLTEEIAANEDNKDPKEEAFEKWKAASNIAPVYFNAFGKGSSIHPQFNNNSRTGDVNVSYGISTSYAFNKNLSVRTGVNKVNLGYSTNGVIVFNNVKTLPDTQLLRTNIELTENAQNMSFISADNFKFAQVPGVISNNINGSIDQRLGFIEVPLELEYRISDKKVGINVIGGFSALFLNENEVFSVFDGNTILLGKATNINNTSFSANFGLGFDFRITDKFNLNLEPVFKYQINTFNNTSGNFKPYLIGVYSGISFKF
jgi:hypothetical protein